MFRSPAISCASMRSALPNVRPGLRSVGHATVALVLLLNILNIAPPLQDYGDWVYQGFLLKLILSGHDVMVTLKDWPVPNAISQVILAAAMFLVSPIHAAKIFISVYLLLFTLLCSQLTTARDGTRDAPRFVLLILLGVVNSTYWNGYVNFQIGLLILLFYIALRRSGRSPGLPVEMLFGVLIFFSHAICLGAFLVLVGCDSAMYRRKARGLVAVAPSLLLVLWYLLANSSRAPELPQVDKGGPVTFMLYKFYTLAKFGPYQNFIVHGIGDPARHAAFYAGGVVVNFAFGLLFVLPLCLGAFVMMARRRITPEILTAILCFTGFLVLPGTLFGIVNVGERLLAIACVLAVIAVDLQVWLVRLGAAIACLMPLTAVSGLVVTLGVTEDKASLSSEIDDPHRWRQILFWHRSFEFLDEMKMSQQLALSGTLPTHPPGFDTSILGVRAPPVPGR